jgi:hypothetical protein
MSDGPQNQDNQEIDLLKLKKNWVFFWRYQYLII